jgi:acyl-CoA thioester hydrolase
MSQRLVVAPEFPLDEAPDTIRVLYADIDRMGMVYHATYLRYLEHARVEFIRKDVKISYSDLEQNRKVGLPVIDLAMTFLNPAVYDDKLTVEVGLTKVSRARVHFAYRVIVKPGHRQGFAGPEPIEVLRAQTFHGCLSMEDRRAAALPADVYDDLKTYLEEHRRACWPIHSSA